MKWIDDASTDDVLGITVDPIDHWFLLILVVELHAAVDHALDGLSLEVERTDESLVEVVSQPLHGTLLRLE